MFKPILKNIFIQKLIYQRCYLFNYLNSIANRVNKNRIKEIGTDNAAAEWLLRNGASFKWKNVNSLQSSFNDLPKNNYESYKLEEIIAKDSSISSIGFLHLDGLKHLKKIIITNNKYIQDDVLNKLELVSESLTDLHIASCVNITDVGIKQLSKLKKLKILILENLDGVQDKENCLLFLKNELPNCKIHWVN